MSNMKKLHPLVLATTLAVSGLALPTFAQAEVSSSLTISSMYLWRGLDISDGKPALSSSIQYDHDSGLYVGTWFSNEGRPAVLADDGTVADAGTFGTSYEIDGYFGFAKEFGAVGVDLAYVLYTYPEALGPIGDSDIKEYVAGVSLGDLTVKAYINAEPDDFDDYKYYTVDYSFGPLGLHVGKTDVGTAGGDYNDYAISYALSDELSWTLSSVSGDAIASDSPQSDPLIMVSYSVPLN